MPRNVLIVSVISQLFWFCYGNSRKPEGFEFASFSGNTVIALYIFLRLSAQEMGQN